MGGEPGLAVRGTQGKQGVGLVVGLQSNRGAGGAKGLVSQKQPSPLEKQAVVQRGVAVTGWTGSSRRQ